MHPAAGLHTCLLRTGVDCTSELPLHALLTALCPQLLLKHKPMRIMLCSLPLPDGWSG